MSSEGARAEGAGHGSGAVPAAKVAAALLARFGEQVCEQAVCLRTSVPQRVSLNEAGLPVVVRRFIQRYDPIAAERGLYTHQADVLRRLSSGELHDILLTSATGSGKSLALWGSLVQAVTALSDATALACFPTQALLWGQVERLRSASEPASLVDYQGQVYAGTIKLGPVLLPWTAWHGVSDSKTMAQHERSEPFRRARIRITTVDKVHWSLMQEEHSDFLSRLVALGIDEAHAWHGLVGANVRALFNRLHATLDLHRQGRPALFLASATLTEPRTFAGQLTGRKPQGFQHIDDGGATQASVVNAADVPQLIEQAAKEDALLRFVMMLAPFPTKVSAQALLQDEDLIGADTNALCFVQNKFVGHRLGHDLIRSTPARKIVVYDGDLPAEERRRAEQQFHEDAPSGRTIIGTSALELGVDLPELDFVVMDELPNRLHELLQRIGRIGRRSRLPGLAILCLDHSPMAQRLTDAPASELSAKGIPPAYLPLHLEHVRLRAMKAFFHEWQQRLSRREVGWPAFNQALKQSFGEILNTTELQQRLDKQLGDLVDQNEPQWFYQGFRPTLSAGKYPLVRSDTGERVALIDGASLYRDAHPEGVYLSHRGESFRIVQYRSRRLARPASQAQSSQAFLDRLGEIVVEPESTPISTCGRWRETVELLEKIQPAHPAAGKRPAVIDYGKWEWRRRFDGYTEYALRGRTPPKEVSVKEVTQRYHAAAQDGEPMPFLPELRFRTLGWRWKLGASLKEGPLRAALADALAALLGAHFCAAVECSPSDLWVTVTQPSPELRVLDRTPGGNGLSEALLRRNGVAETLGSIQKRVHGFIGEPEEWFFHSLNKQGRCPTAVSAEEVASAIGRIVRLL